MRFSKLNFLWILSFVCLFSAFSYAFDFSLNQSRIILGQSQQATLVLRNPGKSPLAIEIFPAARSYTVDGVEKLDDAFDQLVVFPSQIILGAGEEQTVAVRWVGPVVLERERAFRLVAENVPIEITTANYGKKNTKNGQIRMLYRIVKSFYVQPPQVSSQLQVVSAKTESTKEGEFLVVKLVNSGTGHCIVNGMDFEVVFSNPKFPNVLYTCPVKFDFVAMAGGTNFLAAEERNLRIKVSKDWKVPESYQASSAVIKSVVYSD